MKETISKNRLPLALGAILLLACTQFSSLGAYAASGTVPVYLTQAPSDIDVSVDGEL